MGEEKVYDKNKQRWMRRRYGMEWYGVDRQGNIAVFCSGGVGNLPEFVCENEERADELIEFFAKMEKITGYEQLPQHMREILKHNFMEMKDFSVVDTIEVKHAYE